MMLRAAMLVKRGGERDLSGSADARWMSIAATKARAVNCPTPGTVISRRQAAEALVMRFMSASIAATAAITAVRAANQTPHGGGEAGDPLACLKSLVDEGCGQRARQADTEHDRQSGWLCPLSRSRRNGVVLTPHCYVLKSLWMVRRRIRSNG
jgi:hypothetical protein